MTNLHKSVGQQVAQIGGGDCGFDTPWSTPPGPPGQPGPPRTEPIPLGQPGAAGKIDIKGQAKLADLTTLVSPSHVSMMINACERDYVNQQFSMSLDRLLWLKAITGTILAFPTKQQPVSTELASYKSHSSRINSLIQQLKMGLDYYGEPLNQVPLLSVEYYKNLVDELMSYAESIEQSYLAYRDAKKTQQQQMTALLDTKSKALLAISQSQTAMGTIFEQQSQLDQAIQRLEAARSETWVQLMAAEAAFKSAVAAQGGGCDFALTLAIAASVATLVATGGTAAAAIGAAWSVVQNAPLKYDNGKPVADDFSGFKFKVNTIVAAGQDAKSFGDAFSKVKDDLTPKLAPGSTVPPLPGDEAKIVASASDIEEQLKPYLSMPEAQKYKNVIRNFVDISIARNNKILEYNNSEIEWQKLNASVTQTQDEAAALQTKIASTNNPFIGEAATFMDRAWLESKTSLVRVLSQIDRAYRYYSLSEDEFEVTDFSVSALKVTAQDIILRYSASKERFGALPSKSPL